MVQSDLSSQKISHPLLGMYQDIKILDDIIEPILEEKEWENTDNEWKNYAQPKHRFTIN